MSFSHKSVPGLEYGPHNMVQLVTKRLIVVCFLMGVAALPSDMLNEKICGTIILPRIVNGIEAHDGQFPWVVNLHSTTPEGVVRCAGSLITSRHVLTAGHCLETEVAKIIVSYGSAQLASAQEVPVRSLIRHKDFNADTLEHDVMVLLLAEDMKFSRTVRPICLPTPRLNPRLMRGLRGMVAGFGTLVDPSEQKKYPSLNMHTEKLMQTTLPILNDSLCSQLSEAATGKNLYISGSQICTHDKATDTCVGDSGGPLIVHVKNRYYQMGIVSGGQECAGAHPGVYANVFTYIPWIIKVVNSLG